MEVTNSRWIIRRDVISAMAFLTAFEAELSGRSLSVNFTQGSTSFGLQLSVERGDGGSGLRIAAAQWASPEGEGCIWETLVTEDELKRRVRTLSVGWLEVLSTLAIVAGGRSRHPRR